jgi:signal transduction histidine kinase
VFGVLPVIGLITMLIALAVLQLRSSKRVSEAERDRLQENLQRATSGFQTDFAQDLLEICQTLQASQTRDPHTVVSRLFDRYSVWRRVSGRAPLMRGLYLAQESEAGPGALLQLDPQTRKLESAVWPSGWLAQLDEDRIRAGASASVANVWVWDNRLPALIHPVYALQAKQRSDRPQLLGYLVVLFHAEDFVQTYIPSLAAEYFPPSSGFVFQLIEQQAPGSGRRVLYQSTGTFSSNPFGYADASIALLDSTRQYVAAGGTAFEPQNTGSSTEPVLVALNSYPRWNFAVRHRSGSVNAAVMTLRRRDLAISTLVLATLAVSLVMILVVARRSRRLALLQMEFASSVSHELRTPLAVISSAAENLADGIVLETNEIRRYGALIHGESQRLRTMIEHILNFAHLNSNQPPTYLFEAVAIETIVSPVLDKERGAIESAGLALTVDIATELPLLYTNVEALQQCVQNLVTNALKYGVDGKRIVISVSQDSELSERYILISIEDFGSGLSGEDLAQIYDPFYRGANARDTQIRGTGLGLSLTRRIMQELNGSISAVSSPGKGSVFTLHVPAMVNAHMASSEKEQ